MASLYTNQQLPTTSEQAIREFNEKYLAVATAGPPPDWAQRFVVPVGAPRITYPLSALALKFRETKADSRFKKMLEKSFDLKVVEFDDGIEAPVIELLTNSFRYRNWMRAPDEFVKGEARHVCRQLATILEAGTSGTTPWDDLAFFHTAHKANPFDPATSTFSNYNNAGLDPASEANLNAECASMMGVLDINGDKLGVVPKEIWLPTAKFQTVSNFLSKQFINNGESNAMAGKLKPVHVPELTDTNDWYLVDPDMIAAGFDPMIAAQYVPGDTLGLRLFDESSDHFKKTSNVMISKHIWWGFGMAFPHAIRRVAGA